MTNGLGGWTALVALAVGLIAADGSPAGSPDRLQVYFGDLAAPAEAAVAARARYHQAREAGMDFLAVAAGAPAIPLAETADSVTAAASGAFVALDAWSFGPPEIGQPVIVLGGRRVEDPTRLPRGRFDLFYRFWLPEHADPVEGPPALHLPRPVRWTADYGMASLGSLEALREAMQPYARTMQVLGPTAGGEGPAASAHTGGGTAYLDYLNAGFRLAPTADGWASSGLVASGGRTAVLAANLTRGAVLDGIRRRRVYATGDPNLRMSFTINGYPMGSVVPVTPGIPLRIEVTITDPDEPDAHYWVSLRRDVAGGIVEAASELYGTDYYGDGRVVFSQFRRTGATEYFLIQVLQHSVEGTDLAWSAPIWLVEPTGAA